MNDLFSAASGKKSNEYSAKDIEVLEGLEPVRRRPGMYIGGTDERALHHLVAELLDNAMDEAVAGQANRIEVELDEAGIVTVRDNGRGIPVDPHPKFKDKSALEVILTTLHSGGKFSGKVYQTSGGLHGVGLVGGQRAGRQARCRDRPRQAALLRRATRAANPRASSRKPAPSTAAAPPFASMPMPTFSARMPAPAGAPLSHGAL